MRIPHGLHVVCWTSQSLYRPLVIIANFWAKDVEANGFLGRIRTSRNVNAHEVTCGRPRDSGRGEEDGASLKRPRVGRFLPRPLVFCYSDSWKCGSLSFILTHPPEDFFKRQGEKRWL